MRRRCGPLVPVGLLALAGLLSGCGGGADLAPRLRPNALPTATHKAASAAVPTAAVPLPVTRTPAAGDPAAAVPAPHLVVLGDSVAAGAGCGCTTYADLLADRLANRAGQPASVVNAGQNGLDTAGLREQLDDPDLAADLQDATTVTVTIGANDFDESQVDDADCGDLSCYASQLDALPAAVHDDLARLAALTRPSATVLITGYWNVFRDGSVGTGRGSDYVRTSTALTEAVNRVLAQQAAASGVRYVDLVAPFAAAPGGVDLLLADDGDHPSATGHRVIADALARAAR